jgi:RND family efflux transporter MFP subunit
MKLWKQLLLSLAILAVALVLWIALFPSAVTVLGRMGLAGPVASLQSAFGLTQPTGGGQKSGGQGSTQAGAQAGGGQGAPAAAPGQGGKSGVQTAQGGAAAGGQGGAAAGGQGGGQAGGGPRSGFSRGPALVVVKAATSTILNDRVLALGTGAARQSAPLAPKASGTLTELDVASGDKVAASATIARLDSDAQQIAYDKAKLTSADTQKTLTHDQALVSSGAMPASQLQSVELAASMADLSLRSAKNDLDDRVITAPFAGVVGLVSVNPGIAVTPQTVIATLEDTSSLVIRFALPERLIGAVKPGQSADLVPVARPDLALTATVTAIDAQIDPASGTFQVQAELPNPDGTLVSGMTFAVTLHFPGDPYVAVDPLAIQWGSQGAYVWRLTADSKVEKVSVRIVQRNTDAVLVAGNVAEGDPIVTEGLDGLRPGAQVQQAGAGGKPAADAAAGGQAQGDKPPGAAPALAAEAATATATADGSKPKGDWKSRKDGAQTQGGTATPAPSN